MSIYSDKFAHVQVILFRQVSTHTGCDQLLIFRCTNIHPGWYTCSLIYARCLRCNESEWAHNIVPFHDFEKPNWILISAGIFCSRSWDRVQASPGNGNRPRPSWCGQYYEREYHKVISSTVSKVLDFVWRH